MIVHKERYSSAFEEFSKKLMVMGFKEYEAKVYLALLTLGPATAREIYELSRVPRPKVYDVLKQLSERGIVEIQEGKPTLYRAVPLKKVAEDFEQNIQQITKEITSFIEGFLPRRFPMPSYTATLLGERSIFRKLREVVAGARETLYVGIPTFDPYLLKKMLPIFEIAHKKRVKMVFLLKDATNDLMTKLKKLGQVKKIKFGMQGDELVQIIMHYLFKAEKRHQKILFAVNKDKSEMLFVTEHGGRMFGIWIGLKIMAELQGKIMEKIVGY